MRLISGLLVLASMGLIPVLGTDSAYAQGALACESEKAGGDLLEVKCPFSASGAVQNFRFKVNFLGGHDDTMASMSATLNAQPLACDKDSKTSLMAEEGEVSLVCRFSMKEKAGTNHLLAVRIEWSHAQYANFELDAE